MVKNEFRSWEYPDIIQSLIELILSRIYTLSDASCSSRKLKLFCQKEKLLMMSKFSVCHNIFFFYSMIVLLFIENVYISYQKCFESYVVVFLIVALFFFSGFDLLGLLEGKQTVYKRLQRLSIYRNMVKCQRRIYFSVCLSV